VTFEHYAVSVGLFHAIVLTASWRVLTRWTALPLRETSTRGWLASLWRDFGGLAVFAYGVSLVVPFTVNHEDGRRLPIGQISERLMGQALFGEAILLSLALAFVHRRAARLTRACAFAVIGLGLCGVYVQAYRLEPFQLRVRKHVVEQRGDGAGLRASGSVPVSAGDLPARRAAAREGHDGGRRAPAIVKRD
jgi:hypothetical protein